MSWARRISKLGWVLFAAFLILAVVFSLAGIWISPEVYTWGIIIGIVCIGMGRVFELFEGEEE